MTFLTTPMRALALTTASLALALPAALSAATDARAQEASITVRTGPAYGSYDEYDYGPGYRSRYYSYSDDEPAAVDRAYDYDRDNLRTDRSVRRFIDKQRDERGGGEN